MVTSLPEAASPESTSFLAPIQARPVRTADYHNTDEDEEPADDEALLLDAEKRVRRRADSVTFDFNDRILFASSSEGGLGSTRLGPPAEPISVLGGVALIVGKSLSETEIGWSILEHEI